MEVFATENLFFFFLEKMNGLYFSYFPLCVWLDVPPCMNQSKVVLCALNNIFVSRMNLEQNFVVGMNEIKKGLKKYRRKE